MSPSSDVDPVYFNSPYYLYPDGQMAVDAIRVIDAVMAHAGVAGIGRLTLSRRERMVMVEPSGTGMVVITLRAVDEVRAPQFTSVDGAIDAEMLAISRAIIAQRTGKFDPSKFRDRYQPRRAALGSLFFCPRLTAASPRPGQHRGHVRRENVPRPGPPRCRDGGARRRHREDLWHSLTDF